MLVPFFFIHCRRCEVSCCVLLLPAAVDNPVAEFLDAFVVGERAREVLRLAPFDKVAPHVFVFPVQAEVFFDGAFGPYPNALAAEFRVDAPDGTLGFGHGGHHGVCLCGGDVTVLAYGEPVHKAQVVMEG